MWVCERGDCKRCFKLVMWGWSDRSIGHWNVGLPAPLSFPPVGRPRSTLLLLQPQPRPRRRPAPVAVQQQWYLQRWRCESDKRESSTTLVVLVEAPCLPRPAAAAAPCCHVGSVQFSGISSIVLNASLSRSKFISSSPLPPASEQDEHPAPRESSAGSGLGHSGRQRCMTITTSDRILRSGRSSASFPTAGYAGCEEQSRWQLCR